MASNASEASSDDAFMDNIQMEMVDIRFSEENLIHPWQDKNRAKEWMKEEVLNASGQTKNAQIMKILFFRGPRRMLVYLQNLSHHAATDIVVARIKTLVGPIGKVRLLRPPEVENQMEHDKRYKMVMKAKEHAVGGDLGGVQSLLLQAMNYGGKVEDQGPCKRQKTMGAQVVECLWTAQQVAKSGVQVKAMQLQGVDAK